MKVNVKNSAVTHEGAKAEVALTPYQRLARTVLANMLFENNYYENGVDSAKRITELCAQCSRNSILELAEIASKKYHLRHIPLQLIVESIKNINIANFIHQPSHFIERIITRPDQMTDLLALYWKEKRIPLANQLKKGLAKAFTKFDEYQLAKYNRNDAIKLRDVLFMVHAKPIYDNQPDLWKRLVNNELKTPDTWETRLSAGEDKNEAFSELLEKGKMGKLAILRNMRNIKEAGVPKSIVERELLRNLKEMLPFQYLAAARECPEWEDIIDQSMIQACALKPKLAGQTVVLVDVSGSMAHPLSDKSKMTRMDAACGLAILLRECCENVQIASFSERLVVVPPRHGMALRDALIKSQPNSSTYLGAALNAIIKQQAKYDRMIVITDEQSQDNIPKMGCGKHYILNIAGYQNGIGNINDWLTITGFSEASIDYIRELESM